MSTTRLFLRVVIGVMTLAMLLNLAMSSDFDQLFLPNWAPDHISTQDHQIKLTLDTISGCGFESKKKYLFGKVSMQVKLIEGDSAGTVTALYMASEGANHDEVDFEFLGNVSGEPYLVQTNVYVNGTGNREQRHTLWFDPTAAFHTYSFLWTRYYILFLVDEVPIRVFANREENGGAYPKEQAMGIRGSVWNADDWATQGGRVKTNWSHSPFVSTFTGFAIDACESSTPGTGSAHEDIVSSECGKIGEFWWDKPKMSGMNKHKTHQLRWVRRRHLVYDYCSDTSRFKGEMPRECIV